MLQYVTDVVNGHREPNVSHPWPQGASVALYFDLSDAIGFEGLEEEVCRAAFGQQGTWRQFIGYVQREYRGRPTLLVLDNVNSPSLWTPLGSAASQYLLARPGDSVVLGSIEPLHFDTLDVGEVDVGGLDLDAFAELAMLEGLSADDRQIVELHDQWGGLPYYAGPRGTRHAALAERVELAPGTRRLLAYAALLAIVTRRVPRGALEHCPISDFETHLSRAIDEKLLVPTVDGGFVTMHDIARDDTLRIFSNEVSDAASMLFEKTRQRGETTNAAVFAMFADPRRIGAENVDAVMQPVIRTAIDSRNYALLESLYEKSRSNESLLEFLFEDRTRSDLFSMGRVVQLAGLGHYEAAEEELLETSITASRDWITSASTLQLELRYQQLDIAHLLNRYEEAVIGFEELARIAGSAGNDELQVRCVWAQAHVLRHQGRDLDRAMALFSQAEDRADQLGLLSVKSLSVIGASMIKVFRASVPDDEEGRLEDLEQAVAVRHAHDGHMLGIWTALAQVDWIRGRKAKAMERVEDAIQKARSLNDRLLYDLLFERAEFLRLTGDGASALEDYDRAFRFGMGNHDRNLTSISLLGLVLADLALGRWEYHSSKLEARGSALRARNIAMEADIQVTKRLAEVVVAKLDGALVELPTRLINF
jgi:tetratricopeptide (TPR) repeat protein